MGDTAGFCVGRKGSADKTSRWPIGEVTFNEGKYSFFDLADVEKNTLALKLKKDI